MVVGIVLVRYFCDCCCGREDCLLWIGRLEYFMVGVGLVVFRCFLDGEVKEWIGGEGWEGDWNGRMVVSKEEEEEEEIRRS